MKKINAEYIYLLVVFSLLLLHPAIFWGYKISHDFPYGYLASDAFQHQTRVESIKEMGNYRHEAPYIVKGFDNVIGYYPPSSYHLAVMLSYISGLETYDSMYLMIFLFGCFSALLMYLIIRRFNKNIAILSLPLSVLIFSRASYIGFTWGHWPSITGQFLLLAFVFSLFFIESKKWAVLSGLLLAGTALSHTSEAIFAVLFLFIYLIFNLICQKPPVKDRWHDAINVFDAQNSTKRFLSTQNSCAQTTHQQMSGILLFKKRDFSLTKKSIFAGILFLVISFYYLLIFNFTWAKQEAFYFHVLTDWGGTPIFSLLDFKMLVLILMAIGFVFALLAFRETAVLFAIFALAIGYGNYIGFDFRAFQIRLFWPIYLSLFLGLGLYQLLKMFKLKKIYYIGIALLFLIFFSGTIKIPFLPQSEKLSTPGMLNPYHWETLTWFRENTPVNSKIYFFYGDTYNQDAVLRNTERDHFLIVPKDFISALNNRTIKRTYLTELPGDSGGGIPYRKSFFQFGSYLKEHRDEIEHPDGDICNFDYYVFDKVSSQQVLAQYNLLIANELLKKDWIKPVFENQVSVILKNNKPGEDCIEPRTF